MKKLIALALILAMALALTACGGNADAPAPAEVLPVADEQTPAPAPDASQAQPASGEQALVGKAGDTASFGSYDGKPIEWLCLAVSGDKALLTTKNCIRLDVFHEVNGGDEVAWADSTIRAWLNGEFYDGFTQEEQALILDTTLSSNENMGYNDFPEDDVEWYETTDKAFLLSADEIDRYFSGEEARVAILALSDEELAAAYDRYLRLYNYVDEDGSLKNDMFALNGQPIQYWLRSNGRGRMVQSIYADGSFDDYGSNQDGEFKGVRPAVWVSLANVAN